MVSAGFQIARSAAKQTSVQVPGCTVLKSLTAVEDGATVRVYRMH